MERLLNLRRLTRLNPMRKSLIDTFNKYSFNKYTKNLKKLTNLKVKSFNNEEGEAVSGVIVSLIISVLILILLAAMAVLVIIPKPGKTLGSGNGAASGKLAKEDTNNLPTDENTNNLAINVDSNNLPIKEDYQDSATAYLVCVNLPGLRFPRTPALDRRVAEHWLAVRKDLEASGIPLPEVSWAFRTNCQQINVKPSANPNNRTGHNSKAEPGRSPHEAGRALDVKGMTSRRDRAEIVAIFKRHEWRWLGVTDPPHFDIEPHVVGEASSTSWIRKIQESYKQGYPKQGCRGPECGE